MSQYYTYILASKRNGTLYIGVTNNLIRRIYEHKNKLADGFTKKYNIVNLVYFEIFYNIKEAVLREKKLKKLKRIEKIKLIERKNSRWVDLYSEIIS